MVLSRLFNLHRSQLANLIQEEIGDGFIDLLGQEKKARLFLGKFGMAHEVKIELKNRRLKLGLRLQTGSSSGMGPNICFTVSISSNILLKLLI